MIVFDPFLHVYEITLGVTIVGRFYLLRSRGDGASCGSGDYS